jgi:hypothetical protein
MTKRYICVIAVIGVGLAAAAPAVKADATDTLLASVGQFELGNGETKTVKRGTQVKAYRVCMDEGRYAVPLKVTYDGKEAIVEPGECHLIEAAKVKLASATRLRNGTTLIGSFDTTSRSRLYKTNVSVAQANRGE